MLEIQDRLTEAFAGQYALVREIGQGGMATVYLARDLRHGRQVAIKVLREDLVRNVGAERFLREIRLAARLSHPGILPLFDSGNAGSGLDGAGTGLLYYVMPYIEGESLRGRLARERQLPVDDVVRIAGEVAAALDHAHRQGIVHRDIKPENILLHEGHALVADFGIGKVQSEAEGKGAVTRSGVMVGTPAYVSPEQAAGDAVDGRSDLYSLGCVVYEMLSGEPPFTGHSARAVIAKRFVQKPADLTALRDGVPRPVARAVQKVLAGVPIDRYSTGAEFAAALREADAGTPPAPEQSIAVLPFDSLSSDADNEFFADGITEEILNALAAIPGLRVAGRASSFSFKGKHRELRAIGEQLHVRTVLEGSVRRAGNRVRITAQLNDAADGYRLWSERYDREIGDVFALQDEIATAIAARLRTTLDSAGPVERERATENIEAYEAYLKGRAHFYRRGAGVRDGLALMQRALELDPRYAPAWAGRADGYSLLGYYGALAPETWVPAAREAAAKALELGPHLAETHNALAQVSLLADWDWPGTERGFRRALELNPAYLQAAAWYGLLYLGTVAGRWSEAIEVLEAARRNEPLSSYAAACLALGYAYGGRTAEAVRMAERACELDDTSFLALWSLTNSLYVDGQFARSVQVGDRLLAVSGRHPWGLFNVAVSAVAGGDMATARAMHDELTARAAREFISPFHRGMAAALVGEVERAESLLAESLARRDPAIPLFLRWASAEPALRQLAVAEKLFEAIRLPGIR
ncbi:MAG TPA: protein kinase [Gemmatimonadales bacterium]|nr:protein kinase [Gemmatimonadales bacterium]